MQKMNVLKIVKTAGCCFVLSIKSSVKLLCLTIALCVSYSASAATPLCKQSGGTRDCAHLVFQKTNYDLFATGTSPTAEASASTVLGGIPPLIADMNSKTESPHLVFAIHPEISQCTKMQVNVPTTGVFSSLRNGSTDYNCMWAGYWDGVKLRESRIYAEAEYACPTGYSYYLVHDSSNPELYLVGEKFPGTCLKNSTSKITPKQPPPIYSDPEPKTCHPIQIGTGIKAKLDVDYAANGFDIKRVYSSSGIAGVTNIGANWKFAFERRLTQDTATWVTVFRPDSRALYFKLINNVWTPDADISDKLIAVSGGGWTYYDASTNATEYYDNQGYLTSVVSQNNRTTTFTTDILGRVTSITNDLGQQVSIAYRTDLPVVDYLQLPDGSHITYGYTTTTGTTISNNLTSVTYPDTSVRTYYYGEAEHVSSTPATGVSYANAMTGVTDENGVRYIAYKYDAQGRAYDEVFTAVPGNVNHYALSYTMDGSGNPTSTVVTDPLGTARTYNFSTILGVVKSTGSSQPGGAGCAASSAAMTYDASGNVASRTDFNGNKTTYGYDTVRNLETTRTEGLTTAGAAITGVTRTITTAWDSTWHLPTLIEEYAGATASGTPVKRTTLAYDTKGNLTSRTETDPASSLDRTTTITYTYSATVPGLVLTKVVDGPRSDVSDVTTYTYYDETDSCIGCRGELKTLTDALGRTTQFTDYNLNSQLLSSTDPNGLTTTNTYDLRQRLLSRTVGTETTTLTYDGVGQVTTLTLPDNSTLTYTYDNAHRLTKIEDALGNSISYTLDAMGNRIAEDIKDPSNVLTKHLARSYDALNRLQTLTGVGQE